MALMQKYEVGNWPANWPASGEPAPRTDEEAALAFRQSLRGASPSFLRAVVGPIFAALVAAKGSSSSAWVAYLVDEEGDTSAWYNQAESRTVSTPDLPGWTLTLHRWKDRRMQSHHGGYSPSACEVRLHGVLFGQAQWADLAHWAIGHYEEAGYNLSL